jgi:signal transduction histidine kinase
VEQDKEQYQQIQLCKNADYEEENTMPNNKYFAVKSIKVNWENNKNSCLHLFIDTTNVSKLEEERATNKCQKIMFASMSHEFRTPLNAINNAFVYTQSWLEEKKELNTESLKDQK